MKNVVIIALIAILILITACSSDSQLTGEVTKNIASSLTISVRSENGSLIEGAEIHVNNELKGKTRKYGESEGTRTIILQEKENSISARKEGYASSAPIRMEAREGETQFITITLEEEKVDYSIKVRDKEENPIENAQLYLYQENTTILIDKSVTNKQGEIFFKDLEDGNYTVSVLKEGYAKGKVKKTILLEEEKEASSLITLTKEPELVVFVRNEREGLPDAEVSFYTEEQYNSPGAWPLESKLTDEEGYVAFKKKEPGEYVVAIRSNGYRAVVEEISLTEGKEAIDIIMERSS